MKSGASNRWFVLAVVFGAGLLTINGLVAWNLWRREAPGGTGGAVFLPGDGGRVSAGDPLTWIFPSPPPRKPEAPVIFSPQASGRFLWSDDRTLTFTPSSPWPPCTSWEARFKPDFLPAGGGTAYRGRFSFSSAPLNLLGARQTAWAGGDLVELTLSFNAPVSAASLLSGLRFHYPGGEEIPWTLLPPAAGRELRIKAGPIRERTGSIRLSLAAGLPPAAGSLSLPETVTRDITLAAELKIDSVRPHASLRDRYIEVTFSQPVNPARVRAHLSVVPALECRVESSAWNSSGVRIRGEFLPNTVYSLRFDRELETENGVRAEGDLELSACLPDLKPEAGLADGGRYLTALGSRRLRIESVNLGAFSVESRRIYPNNVAELVHQEQSAPWYWGERAGGNIASPVRQREIRIPDAPRNQVHGRWFELSELTGETAAGIFALTLAADEIPGWEQARRIIVVTDLGLSVQTLPGEALVRAASIREGHPLPGVRVEIRNSPNQLLAAGETAPDGCLRLELPAGEGIEPYLVTAQNGDDFNFLPLPGSRVRCGRKLSGPDFPPDPAQAFLYTDRGVYRPGETVHCRALLRKADFSLPDPFPVGLRILGPDGRLFRELAGFTGDLAAAEFSLDLPDYAGDGFYRLELILPGAGSVLGRAGFRVADFVPPSLEVAIAPPGDAVPGEELVFGVSSRYYTGTPAGGLLLKGRLDFLPLPFRPAGWEDWAFGDEEKKYVPGGGREFNLQLDEEGQAEIAADAPADIFPPAALEASLSASVIEAGGRAVTARGAARIHPYPFYVGIRGVLNDQTLPSGSPVRLEIAAVNPGGAVRADTPALEASISRITWPSVLSRDDNGNYSYTSHRRVEEPWLSGTVSLQSGRGTFEFSPAGWGEHLLQVRDPESGSSTSLVFRSSDSDQDSFPWSLEFPERVEVSPIGGPFRPGETARISVRAPFGGYGLLQVETSRLVGWEAFTLEGNSTVLSVTLDESCLPGVHCTVSVYRPLARNGEPAPARAVGSVYLPVVEEKYRLALEVSSPPELRPGEELDLAFTLNDFLGHPVPGEITAAVVDEGILALTGFAAPDPFGFFSSPRRALGALHDLYSLLLPDREEGVIGGPSAPGGDGETEPLAGRLSPLQVSRFQPFALWSGPLASGEDGRANWSIRLPEFSGKLRVMAVASSTRGVGGGTAELLVRSPLEISDSLPRFLAPGDTCRPAFTVRNLSAGDGALSCAVSARGALALAGGEPWHWEGELEEGRETSLVVPLRAGEAPGEASLVFTASLGGETVSRTFHLPVRPPSPRMSRVETVVVRAGETWKFPPLPDSYPGSNRARLTCSGLPDTLLTPGLDFLLEYPYGCLEQTASTVFPLIYLKDLLPAGLPGGAGQGMVEEGIRRIIGMQTADGGFSYWPAGTTVNEPGSLYAAHFLLEASRHGYDVPRDRIDAALDWCQGRLRRREESSAPDEAWRRRRFREAYAAYNLALAGVPEEGAIRRLFELRSSLTPGTAVTVAAAMARARIEPGEITALLEESEAAIDNQAGGPGAHWLETPVRDLAMLLLARLETDPGSPSLPRLAEAIRRRQTNGRWSTTLENSLALMALGRYHRSRAGTDPSYSAVLTAAGEAEEAFTSQTAFTRSWEAEIPGGLSVRNQGPGDLYLSGRFDYLPASGTVPEEERGIAVQRTWLRPDGSPLEGRELKRGDFLVAAITLDSRAARLDNLVVEDLLPGGLEIENPNLAASQALPPGLFQSDLPAERVEMKDDRLILFTGDFSGRRTFYYGVRALCPGDYLVPPVRVEAMYDPELRGARGSGRLLIGETER